MSADFSNNLLQSQSSHIPASHILALDVGGTHSRMAIVRIRNAIEYDIVTTRDADKHADSIIPQINDFLRDVYNERQIGVSVCCICVAGLVTGNKCLRPTNARFSIDGDEILSSTALKRVLVINDFAAIAYAVSIIDPDANKRIVQVPHFGGSVDEGYLPQVDGNRVAIGPGTGLGVAYVRCEGAAGSNRRFVISPSEGGHSSIGYTAQFASLMRFVQERLHTHHIGKEALICGRGIRLIVDFFLSHQDEFEKIVAANPTFHEDMRKFETGVHKVEMSDDDLRRLLTSDSQPNHPSDIDFAQIVSENMRKNPKCRIAMRVFMTLLGNAAQDVALHGLARGGVFLAGGILPKNKELLLKGDFMQSFSDNWKPNIRDFLAQVPVYLIDDYDISFSGCARAILVEVPK